MKRAKVITVAALFLALTFPAFSDPDSFGNSDSERNPDGRTNRNPRIGD